MGGGGGGGPGSWKRWRELGVRVLVLGRRSHFHTSASSRNCPGDVKTDAVCLASSSHSPVPSNAGIRRGLGHFQNEELTFLSFSPCLAQTGRASSSSASNLAGKNATWFGHKGLSQSSCCQSWHHPSKEGCTQNWARSGRGMSTDVRDECRHLVDVPSTEAQDEEVEHLNVAFHNESPTSSRFFGNGRVEASEGAFDAGNGVKCVFRTGQLRFHSTVPSRIQQRLGEATPVGLQELATALPDSDFVDWQQQRAARVKDSDIRHRPAPRHSSRSDAEPDDIFIPVKAFYISRSVDLKSLAREPFLEVTSSRNNLIIRCADRPPHSPVTADNPEMACLGFLKERYMVAFQYGSVVFFNFGDHEEVESLEAVRKYCTDDIRETRKDAKTISSVKDSMKGPGLHKKVTSSLKDVIRGLGSHAKKKYHILYYGVLVRPTLEEWSEGGHDRVMLRKLDIDNIRVISSVLGQSIALDHYAKKVDEMVTTFSDLNRGMEQSGTFTMTRKSLFQLVAAANTTLADVILRLGLLEKSDAAWKDANYAQIWEYLRDDFELDDRFENLDFKLNIIQHNVRFFLEILQNRKSDTLEWIIILLITGEICVSLYDILHTAGAI